MLGVSTNSLTFSHTKTYPSARISCIYNNVRICLPLFALIQCDENDKTKFFHIENCLYNEREMNGEKRY